MVCAWDLTCSRRCLAFFGDTAGSVDARGESKELSTASGCGGGSAATISVSDLVSGVNVTDFRRGGCRIFSVASIE